MNQYYKQRVKKHQCERYVKVVYVLCCRDVY